MASKQTIIKAIAAIKTVYSYFGKDVDLPLLVDTWTALLHEYTDNEVDMGLYKALKVCKYAPVPADIIEQIEEVKAIKKPCESELWAHYQRALKKVLYYSYRLNYNYIDDSGISQGEQARREIEKVWYDLPQELQIYIGDQQELVTAARALNYSEGLSYERNRFSKTFPILQKRVEASKQLETTKRYLIRGFE
jgi:hypothetical protein